MTTIHMLATMAGAFFFFSAGLVAMALKRGLGLAPAAASVREELRAAIIDVSTWRSRTDAATRDANTWRARAEVAMQEKAMWQARAEAAEAAAEFKPEITRKSDDPALRARIERLETEAREMATARARAEVAAREATVARERAEATIAVLRAESARFGMTTEIMRRGSSGDPARK